ncbi:MAG: hypothetical protein KGK18_17910, partial [Burkholderiales bacterium]|nr:hypothetical protein [Burkholderiales bacterium]
LPAAFAGAAPRAETSLLWPLEPAPAVSRFVEFVRLSLPAAFAGAAPRAETSLLWPLEPAPAVSRFVEFVRLSRTSSGR